MFRDDLKKLRKVSVSQGLMLESVSPSLQKKGGPHHGSQKRETGVRIRQ
ncbi:MAG: hypothetical protein Ct9H300mP28_14210 [Pseudomonadota bacterium]|nr:MAG: hypothetical protein Ct9H300mP28_14210 [Pseudomonadota bacterium]